MRLLNTRPFQPYLSAFQPWEARPALPDWEPRFDVVEAEGTFTVRGDLPGLGPDGFEIRVENGILAVRGERKLDAPEAAHTRFERPRGKFERRFRLPDAVDADGIKAQYEHGVLELTLPKAEPGEGVRLIPVH